MPAAYIHAAFPGLLIPGRLHLPIFGVFAAAGLVAALWLSQRTAPRAGLDPAPLWDAGIVAILSAFLSSRALLLAVNWRLFRAYPLLLLAQPSFTYGGLALTALLTWLWLRHKRLPLRRVLDAMAAPALLCAAVLQVGHFVEGTDAGMPTRLPWGVHAGGDTALGRTHPVQLYGAAAEVALAAVFYRRLSAAYPAGGVAAQALLAAGVVSFLLGFLRQPYALTGADPLDPAQLAALAAIAAGAWLAFTSRSVQEFR